MKEFEEKLEQARLELHQMIDELAKELFFEVESWHLFRTTGMFIYKAEKSNPNKKWKQS